MKRFLDEVLFGGFSGCSSGSGYFFYVLEWVVYVSVDFFEVFSKKVEKEVKLVVLRVGE